MSESLQGLVASSGWTVLHRFFRLDRVGWQALDAGARQSAKAEMVGLLQRYAAEEGLQLVPFVGVAKCDLGLVAVHADLWRIQQITQEVAATTLGALLTPTYEFLSMSEASEYITSEMDWARLLIEEEKLDPADPAFGQRFAALRKRTAMYSQARLHPQLPDNYPIVCFYPMSKARRDKDNWYRLSFEERKKLMLEHGVSGRRFADRITQLITTCTGIDDWEWGVTLFARDLKAVRDIVYELRYDEASAVYGEFGPFYIGIRIQPEQLPAALHLG